MNRWTALSLAAFAFLLGWFAGGVSDADARPDGEVADRVFELRIYTAHEGRRDALITRFRDHTFLLFDRHGMTNVGYWVPQDMEARGDNFVVLLAHESREAAETSWAAFRADPEWQRAHAASEEDGPVTLQAEQIFLDPTPFSPLQ